MSDRTCHALHVREGVVALDEGGEVQICIVDKIVAEGAEHLGGPRLDRWGRSEGADGEGRRLRTERVASLRGVLLCVTAVNASDMDATHTDSESAHHVLTGGARRVRQLRGVSAHLSARGRRGAHLGRIPQTVATSLEVLLHQMERLQAAGLLRGR